MGARGEKRREPTSSSAPSEVAVSYVGRFSLQHAVFRVLFAPPTAKHTQGNQARADERERSWLRNPGGRPRKQQEAVRSVIRSGNCRLQGNAKAICQVSTAEGIHLGRLDSVESEREAGPTVTQISACVCENQRRAVVDRNHLSVSGVVEFERYV